MDDSSPAPRRAALRAELRTARDEIYRARILAAAEQLFADVGYERARMKDLGAGAGLAMGTLYGVFGSKDEVFQAVHDERASELFARVADVVERYETSLQTLTEGVAETVRFFCAHPDYLRMHLRDGIGWASDQQPTERQSTTWRDGVEMLGSVFELGAERGELISTAPLDDARVVMAMLQVKLSSFVAADPRPDVEAVIADLCAMVARTFRA